MATIGSNLNSANGKQYGLAIPAPTVTVGAPSLTTVDQSSTVSYVVTYTNCYDVNLLVGNVSITKTGSVGTPTITVVFLTQNTRRVDVTGITGNGTITALNIAAGTGSSVGGVVPAASNSTVITVSNVIPTATISNPNKLFGISGDNTLNGETTVDFPVSFTSASTVTLSSSDVNIETTRSYVQPIYKTTGTQSGSLNITGSTQKFAFAFIAPFTGNPCELQFNFSLGGASVAGLGGETGTPFIYTDNAGVPGTSTGIFYGSRFSCAAGEGTTQIYHCSGSTNVGANLLTGGTKYYIVFDFPSVTGLSASAYVSLPLFPTETNSVANSTGSLYYNGTSWVATSGFIGAEIRMLKYNDVVTNQWSATKTITGSGLSSRTVSLSNIRDTNFPRSTSLLKIDLNAGTASNVNGSALAASAPANAVELVDRNTLYGIILPSTASFTSVNCAIIPPSSVFSQDYVYVCGIATGGNPILRRFEFLDTVGFTNNTPVTGIPTTWNSCYNIAFSADGLSIYISTINTSLNTVSVYKVNASTMAVDTGFVWADAGATYNSGNQPYVVPLSNGDIYVTGAAIGEKRYNGSTGAVIATINAPGAKVAAAVESGGFLYTFKSSSVKQKINLTTNTIDGTYSSTFGVAGMGAVVSGSYVYITHISNNKGMTRYSISTGAEDTTFYQTMPLTSGGIGRGEIMIYGGNIYTLSYTQSTTRPAIITKLDSSGAFVSSSALYQSQTNLSFPNSQWMNRWGVAAGKPYVLAFTNQSVSLVKLT